MKIKVIFLSNHFFINVTKDITCSDIVIGCSKILSIPADNILYLICNDKLYTYDTNFQYINMKDGDTIYIIITKPTRTRQIIDVNVMPFESNTLRNTDIDLINTQIGTSIITGDFIISNYDNIHPIGNMNFHTIHTPPEITTQITRELFLASSTEEDKLLWNNILNFNDTFNHNSFINEINEVFCTIDNTVIPRDLLLSTRDILREIGNDNFSKILLTSIITYTQDSENYLTQFTYDNIVTISHEILEIMHDIYTSYTEDDDIDLPKHECDSFARYLYSTNRMYNTSVLYQSTPVIFPFHNSRHILCELWHVELFEEGFYVFDILNRNETPHLLGQLLHEENRLRIVITIFNFMSILLSESEETNFINNSTIPAIRNMRQNNTENILDPSLTEGDISIENGSNPNAIIPSEHSPQFIHNTISDIFHTTHVFISESESESEYYEDEQDIINTNNFEPVRITLTHIEFESLCTHCRYDELSENVRNENKTCPIDMLEFDSADIVSTLPCNHIFLQDTISEWLISTSKRCPVCREDVH